MEFLYTVQAADLGERVDLPLSRRSGLSRSQVKRALETGQVDCNGRPLSKKQKLQEGDLLVLRRQEEVPFTLRPNPIPLEILYEDDCLAVVNKPKGMVVHPGAGREEDSLASALLARYGREGLSDMGGPLRPGILHRLDRDTSGLLLVAKTNRAHQILAEQIRAHSFLRRYEAVLHGGIKGPHLVLENQIGRHPVERKKMAVVAQGGRTARTELWVQGRYGPYTHVKLELFTGRTHQIRVQTAQIGHPVCGDPLYGPKHPEKGLQGQCLHARTIGFLHPESGRYLEFTSDLPPYFTAFLQALTTRYGGIYE